ncbi:MAG: pilin [bacterium]|nr:pilin [bacterium]
MKKFLLIFGIGLLLVPLLVFAQGSGEATCMVCRVLNIVKQIVAAIGFGLVVILIIIAGIKYMTAGGDESKTSEARKGIQNALIGLVIVVAAYFLISLAQGLVSESGGGFIQLLTDPCISCGYGGGAAGCVDDWDCPGAELCINGQCQ